MHLVLHMAHLPTRRLLHLPDGHRCAVGPRQPVAASARRYVLPEVDVVSDGTADSISPCHRRGRLAHIVVRCGVVRLLKMSKR